MSCLPLYPQHPQYYLACGCSVSIFWVTEWTWLFEGRGRLEFVFRGHPDQNLYGRQKHVFGGNDLRKWVQCGFFNNAVHKTLEWCGFIKYGRWYWKEKFGLDTKPGINLLLTWCNCTLLHFPDLCLTCSKCKCFTYWLSRKQVGHKENRKRTGVAIRSGFFLPWHLLAVWP